MLSLDLDVAVKPASRASSPKLEGTSAEASSVPTISVVTPAHNESKNLPLLYEKLKEVLEPTGTTWEWVVVDDHSPDETFRVIADIARRDPRVRAVRLARNFGSHTAIMCGLSHSRGETAAVMAADLQDPPESLLDLLSEWKKGAQVVWAVRARREGEKASTVGFARLYYFIMRNVVGLKDMPPTGADFFLADRRVVDTLKQFRETNTSILALITWMGYRQATILYDKKARLHGKSSWNIEKKLKLVVDSVTSFTYLPIRLMSYVGFSVAALGFLYAAFVFGRALFVGHPVEGWASLMVVVLVVGGIQMLMMGVLGEYLWRAFDESKQRPRFWIEADTDVLKRTESEPLPTVEG